MLAIRYGHGGATVGLLRWIDIDQNDIDGNSLLHYAARVGLFDIVRHIFTKTAHINVANKSGKTTMRRLWNCLRLGRFTLV